MNVEVEKVTRRGDAVFIHLVADLVKVVVRVELVGTLTEEVAK